MIDFALLREGLAAIPAIDSAEARRLAAALNQQLRAASMAMAAALWEVVDAPAPAYHAPIVHVPAPAPPPRPALDLAGLALLGWPNA